MEGTSKAPGELGQLVPLESPRCGRMHRLLWRRCKGGLGGALTDAEEHWGDRWRSRVWAPGDMQGKGWREFRSSGDRRLVGRMMKAKWS